MDGRKYDIAVGQIDVGNAATDMTERSFNNERFRDNVMPRIPARRWGHIDDFGGAAVWLMSDASSYYTGEQLMIDGGYTKF